MNGSAYIQCVFICEPWVLRRFDLNSLTQAQILEVNDALAKRKRELVVEVRTELLASDNQHFRDIAGSVTDAADEALASCLVDIEAAFLDRHVRELRDIDEARERIRLGQYGVCIVCSDVIPYARLLAYPTAKRCLGCQQLREKTHSPKPLPSL